VACQAGYGTTPVGVLGCPAYGQSANNTSLSTYLRFASVHTAGPQQVSLLVRDDEIAMNAPTCCNLVLRPPQTLAGNEMSTLQAPAQQGPCIVCA
jgi:hypothetical protein